MMEPEEKARQELLATAERMLGQMTEENLVRDYGAVRSTISPGLRWLTGSGAVIERWMDHPQYRTKDGKRTFMSRPYSLELADIQRVVALAEAKGLRLFIYCPSNYNLSTVLVILTEREH